MTETAAALADEDIWSHYHIDPDDQSRELLILRYTPLVRYVAARMAATLPASIEIGDLTSYGLFGLIDAIDRFEPERGVRFETYAITRIRGSILDEMRKLDWAPRSVRSRARWLARTTEALHHRLQRQPSLEELAEELGWTIQEVYTARQDAAEGFVGHLQGDERQDDLEAATTLWRAPADMTAEDPALNVEVDRTRVLLARGIGQLPERERVVTTLYFRQELTLAEIGDVLGVSESRVCQVYTSAALLLREYLAQNR